MENNLPLIKEIIIRDPPTKYVIPYKNPKFDKDGKLIKEQVFYLTSNLFYNNNTSYHIISKIITETKRFLYGHMKGIPPLELMSLEIVYKSVKDIDLDNKAYFWRKLFMDILKTPTSRQMLNANKKSKDIITTNTIPDDNTKHVRRYTEDFEYGEHTLIFRIYGRVQSTQEEMNLFFK